MDPDVAYRAKQSIQDYAQHTSVMGGIRGPNYVQGRLGNKYLAAARYVFEEYKVHIIQYWKEEVFVSLYQALRMREMMDPYTSMPVWVACAGSTKVKYER